MKNIHPRDNEIQIFTYEFDKCKIEIIKHIQSCSSCTNKVESYRLLANSIKELPKPAIDLDLKLKIMSQVSSATSSKTKPDYFLYSMLSSSLGFIIILLYYFRNAITDFVYSLSSNLSYLIIFISILISLILIIDSIRIYSSRIKKLNY